MMSIGLTRIAQRAKEYPQERFTALLHHLNVELLGKIWETMNKSGAVGVDRMTATAYAKDLEANPFITCWTCGLRKPLCQLAMAR